MSRTDALTGGFQGNNSDPLGRGLAPCARPARARPRARAPPSGLGDAPEAWQRAAVALRSTQLIGHVDIAGGDSAGRGKRLRSDPVTTGQRPITQAPRALLGLPSPGGGANVLSNRWRRSGTAPALMKLRDLHAVWFSHLHADHFADCRPLLRGSLCRHRCARSLLRRPVGQEGRELRQERGRSPHEQLPSSRRAQGPADRRDRRPAIRPALLEHACLPRADGQLGDHRLAYSGDSRPCDNLVSWPKGRILVAESAPT